MCACVRACVRVMCGGVASRYVGTQPSKWRACMIAHRRLTQLDVRVCRGLDVLGVYFASLLRKCLGVQPPVINKFDGWLPIYERGGGSASVDGHDEILAVVSGVPRGWRERWCSVCDDCFQVLSLQRPRPPPGPPPRPLQSPPHLVALKHSRTHLAPSATHDDTSSHANVDGPPTQAARQCISRYVLGIGTCLTFASS